MKHSNKKALAFLDIVYWVAWFLVIATFALSFFNSDPRENNDAQRISALGLMRSKLTDFKSDKWGVFPNLNVAPDWYPDSGCKIDGWNDLVKCLVTAEIIKEGTDEYDTLKEDPDKGTKHDSGEEYEYRYCVDENGNNMRLLALWWWQTSKKLIQIDGTKPAKKWLGYLEVKSRGAVSKDITNCKK
jgi:hypothetical protein